MFQLQSAGRGPSCQHASMRAAGLDRCHHTRAEIRRPWCQSVKPHRAAAGWWRPSGRRHGAASTVVRDTGAGGGGSKAGSEWDVKAPLRAAGSHRNRASDAAPASATAAAATAPGDPSSPDLLILDLGEPAPFTASHPASSAPQQDSASQHQALGSSNHDAKLLNLAILAALAVAAAAKFISVDIDAWDHLSAWELIRQMPESNWKAYDAAVSSSPMLTKACISGIVYTLGDCIAQGYEGRNLGDLDRARVLRSGTCGFIAHGPLSHLYYENLDYFFNNILMVAPGTAYVPFVKLVIDQTVWSLFWNSLYYVLLGILKLDAPSVIIQTVKSSWFDLLKAGWKLWPFAHVITYGIVPVQHRLLWVDSVELVWVTFLSLYAQQQREKLAQQVLAAPPDRDTNGALADREVP